MLWSLVERAILRDGAVADERGAAERSEVDGQLEVPGDAERAGRGARRLDLARVDLAVADAQGVELVAVRPGHRRGGERVEPAAEQHDRPPGRVRRRGHPRSRCTCAPAAAAAPADDRRGSTRRGPCPARTPCTGEIRIAAQRPSSACRADDVLGELVVLPILNDELDLVGRRSAGRGSTSRSSLPRRWPGTSRR